MSKFGRLYKEFGSLAVGYMQTGIPLDWLLYDQFKTAESAPLVSPRTCEPGPGELLIVDTNNYLSIANGALVAIIPLPGANGNPGVWSNTAFARTAGKTLFVKTSPTNLGNALYGWDTDQSVTLDNSRILFNNVAQLKAYYAGSFTGPIGLYAIGNTYNVASVLRSKGEYLIIKGGGYTDWTLLWAGNENVSPLIYPAWASRTTSLNAAHDMFGAIDLPANNYPVFDHRDLDITRSIAAPVTGNTITHTPDGRFSFDVLDNTADIVITFRQSDANNWWYIKGWSGGGNFYEIVRSISGAPTSMGTGGTFNIGDHVDIVFNNDSIDVWLNYAPAPIISLAGAVHNISETLCTVVQAGAGDISNLTFQTLDGIANEDSVNFPGYGLATDILAGPIAYNTAFIHDADFVGMFTHNTLPAGGQWYFLQFRIQDATHYWVIQIIDAGAVRLYMYDGGFNLRATTANGAVVGGERLFVAADGQTITLHIDDVLAWTYALATEYLTETAGNAGSGSSGGKVSDLVIWPRKFGSAPLTKGALQARQAFERMEQEG